MKKPIYLDANTIRHVLSSPWPRGCGKSSWALQLYAEMKRENDALRERLKQLPEISGRGRPSNGEDKSWCSMRRARRPEDQVSNAERCVAAGETATI